MIITFFSLLVYAENLCSLSALLICSKELFHLLHSLVQLTDIRQIYDTEMIRLMPVEALARNDKNLLVMQEIQRKLLIIVDIELLCIDLREDIKCCTRLHC